MKIKHLNFTYIPGGALHFTSSGETQVAVGLIVLVSIVFKDVDDESDDDIVDLDSFWGTNYGKSSNSSIFSLLLFQYLKDKKAHTGCLWLF